MSLYWDLIVPVLGPYFPFTGDFLSLTRTVVNFIYSTGMKKGKNYGRFLLKTPNLLIQNMCDVTTTIIICKKQMLLQSR